MSDFDQPFVLGDTVVYDAAHSHNADVVRLHGVPGEVVQMDNVPSSPHYWNVMVRYDLDGKVEDHVLDHRYLNLWAPDGHFSDELLSAVAFEVNRARRYSRYSDKGAAWRILAALHHHGALK